ncbi:MAG: hypothetical protein ACI4VL_01150 [Bacilli bacterium]
MEKQFTDRNGKSKVIIESNEAPINMPNGNITLANRPKVKVKTMPNIGPKSNGFAGVATLAVIIALAGVLIAYFTLKY